MRSFLDQLALLGSGLLAAAAAWAFFAYLGDWALVILSASTTFALGLDNRRLNREVRKLRAEIALRDPPPAEGRRVDASPDHI